MLEETGYESREVILLGRTRPNPAIQNNWIHTFLARDARFGHAPVFESTEHTVVRLVPLASVPALISDGTINHSLVVVGFIRRDCGRRCRCAEAQRFESIHDRPKH
jgi:hypothetical protein